MFDSEMFEFLNNIYFILKLNTFMYVMPNSFLFSRFLIIYHVNLIFLMGFDGDFFDDDSC